MFVGGIFYFLQTSRTHVVAKYGRIFSGFVVKLIGSLKTGPSKRALPWRYAALGT